MTIVLNVTLLSGRSFSIAASPESKIQELRWQVQKERGISIRQFVAHGHALAAGTLDENGLKDGEDLLAVLGSAQLVASRHCDDFALIKADGTVHAWGRWRIDGPFQRKLVDVQHITANKAAVAAIVSNGEVVTWGSDGSGGNSYTVAAQLFQIQEVVATIHAFAARRADGKVISWGWPNYGGDSEEVQEQLVNVQSVTASKYSFAALKSDGTVVTWGEGACGGDSSAVQEELQDIKVIVATARAFSALRGDGRVITWGRVVSGGESRAVQLEDIHQICASRNAFSAVKHDGTLVTWGKLAGVVPPALPHHCCELVASDGAFAACLAEGSVVAWGDPRYGGAPTATTAAELRDVTQLCASNYAFTALRADGTATSTHGHARPPRRLACFIHGTRGASAPDIDLHSNTLSQDRCCL
ncbi:unnamed protein product [Durusdinium trenchii]|uniref:Ubiquitin-like domain-containing protein n=1 Tax=Durusdinium trenchii TaxID=1381693 RepID=A0ABP0NFU5_9DINO